MDDIEDDARYPPNPYGVSHQQGYGASNRQKLSHGRKSLRSEEWQEVAEKQGGLSCGLDSGEYVFMNPRVYLNRANGLDEMRDSPANSESADSEEDVSDGLPPKKRRFGRQSDEGSSFRLLADSIQKFSDIYEKIENSKRQQMLELEKMRMDFHRELETQKRQIMERAQAEIAKIQQGDDEENDVSADNASG
ncbi:hypothetical protein COLO4_30368 [Corchorus olitorius]|uniref:Trihelix transcription factor ASIL2 n=1 Tax=Corchorus olitorius TaxID=93759 RepID=A0A1R3H8T1_9ROSI|nr:hypothetical protein COLO4_30368 [Corchorus olitorius]